jgi:membrane protein implicated in regulation of membrane protease activity
MAALARALSDPGRAGFFGRAAGAALAIAAAAALLAFLTIAVRSVVERSRRKKSEEPRERYTEPDRGRWRVALSLVVVVALVGELLASLPKIVAALGLRKTIGRSIAVMGGVPRPVPSIAAKDVLPGDQHAPTTIFLLAIGTATIALLATWLIVRAVKARTAKIERRGDSSETMRQAARRMVEALSRPDIGADVRKTILSCYEAMCGLFAPLHPPDAPREHAAVPRAQSRKAKRRGSHIETLTAREFLARLREDDFDDPELAALTEVFEKARYSDEVCTEDDRAAAIAGLRTLEELYRRGVE